MEDYKSQFIDFLLSTGSLGVFEDSAKDRTLKSGRISPWFVNIGEFNEGESTSSLAGYYANAITNSEVPVNLLLYGIPEKGVGLAVGTAIAMAQQGHNIGWCFSRKDEKTHGEASGLGPADRAKKLFVGKVPTAESRICQLDDVFTAGDAKYEANAFLTSFGFFNLPLLAIAVDRQEVATDSRDAIAEYEQRTGTKVVSVVSALNIFDHLTQNGSSSPRTLERLGNYLRVYGTEAARKGITERAGTLEQRIIERDRSVIPACDVSSLEQFEELVKQTANVDGIGGYKLGFELGLTYGLPKVVEVARQHTNKPLIYDHQKAGTDIPDIGRNFARVMKNAGIDTVILFPQAGPETERSWIYHALDNGLNVIVGGRMTHPAYAVSEGGFITDEGALEMYRIAARAGINNFVVPGNKPSVIKQVREVIEAEGVSPIFYAPGFVAQGGVISEAAKVAGDNFHGIVGRGIYQAPDMREAALQHTSKL
ncbi:orotidine 5'-phosphate decarboxylase [Candidatus Woesearchaeota archaeon]|nr:orotidine 5'-phosphate decarboxylase [Candidatus Woesearchaeota archaeon]